MSSRSITLTLNLRDGFSATLNEFSNDLNKVTKKAGGGLNSMISGAVAGVSAAVSTKIMEGIGTAFTSLIDQFKSAADFESDLISGGGKLQFYGAYGSDLQANIDGFENLYYEVEEIAAKLPGATEEYMDFLNQISGAVAKATDSPEEFEKMALDMTQNFGLLVKAGRAQGLLAKDAVRGIQAYASEGWGALEGTELFTKGGAFADALQQIINVEGEAKDYEGRMDQANRAADKAAGDLSNAYNKTFTSIMETFRHKLFGKKSGIFSFYKDLDEEMEGNQSVFEEVKGILVSIVGETGIFASIARLFNLDDNSVMNFIRDSAYNFNMWLARVKLFLLELESLGETSLSVGELASFDWLEGAIDFLITNAIVKPLNWIAENPIDAIAVVGKFILAIGNGLVNAFSNLSWKTLLIGAGVAAAIAGSLTFLGTALGATILTVIGLLAGTITAPVIAAIAAVGLAIVGIFKLFGVELKDITGFISGALKGIWSFIKFGFKAWGTLLKLIIDAALLPFRQFKSSVEFLWDGLISGVNYLIGIANKIPGIKISKIGENDKDGNDSEDSEKTKKKSGKEDDHWFTKWGNRNNKDSIHYKDDKGASSTPVASKQATLEPIKASTVNQIQNTAKNLNTSTTTKNNMTINIARIDTKANAEEVVNAMDQYVNEYNQRNMGVA